MFRLRYAKTGIFRFFFYGSKSGCQRLHEDAISDLTVLRHVETAREKEGSSPYEVTMPFLDLSILDRGEREGERERERRTETREVTSSFSFFLSLRGRRRRKGQKELISTFFLSLTVETE